MKYHIFRTYGTAKSLKNQAAAYMTAWYSLMGGYTYGAAAAIASVVGVGLGVIAGIGAAYCGYAGSQYRDAYNYFSDRNPKSNKQYIIAGEITYLLLKKAVIKNYNIKKIKEAIHAKTSRKITLTAFVAFDMMAGAILGFYSNLNHYLIFGLAV